MLNAWSFVSKRIWKQKFFLQRKFSIFWCFFGKQVYSILRKVGLFWLKIKYVCNWNNISLRRIISFKPSKNIFFAFHISKKLDNSESNKAINKQLLNHRKIFKIRTNLKLWHEYFCKYSTAFKTFHGFKDKILLNNTIKNRKLVSPFERTLNFFFMRKEQGLEHWEREQDKKEMEGKEKS